MDAGAIFHAASSLLEKLDDAQKRFLRTIDITPDHAFLKYNFAPPKLRCNIAMLGMLHKRMLGNVIPPSHVCFRGSQIGSRETGDTATTKHY